MKMGCYFCKQDDWGAIINLQYSEYYICLDCWDKLPTYLPTDEQKWKLIQMRGDKLNAAL